MDILDKVKAIIQRNSKKERTINMKSIQIYGFSDIEEIRMATDKIKYRRIWNFINSEIEDSVRKGKYIMKVWLSDISDEERNSIKDELIKFGFEVEKIEKEIGYEKGLFISWEKKQDEEIKEVN